MDQYSGLKMIERHRLVNKLLAEELKNDIHALSIQAKTGYIDVNVYVYMHKNVSR